MIKRNSVSQKTFYELFKTLLINILYELDVCISDFKTLLRNFNSNFLSRTVIPINTLQVRPTHRPNRYLLKQTKQNKHGMENFIINCQCQLLLLSLVIKMLHEINSCFSLVVIDTLCCLNCFKCPLWLR